MVSKYKNRIYFSRLNAKTPYQDLMVQAAGRRLLSARNSFQESNSHSIFRSEPQSESGIISFKAAGEILDIALLYECVHM